MSLVVAILLLYIKDICILIISLVNSFLPPQRLDELLSLSPIHLNDVRAYPKSVKPSTIYYPHTKPYIYGRKGVY